MRAPTITGADSHPHPNGPQTGLHPSSLVVKIQVVIMGCDWLDASITQTRDDMQHICRTPIAINNPSLRTELKGVMGICALFFILGSSAFATAAAPLALLCYLIGLPVPDLLRSSPAFLMYGVHLAFCLATACFFSLLAASRAETQAESNL